MFRLRAANSSDLPGLRALAGQLDSVNLPADDAELAALVAKSERSFAERHIPRERVELEPWSGDALIKDQRATRDGHFLFVLEHVDAGIIGTSALIAEHGTAADPHHSFRLGVDERYSPALGKIVRHQTLTLQRSLTPHTELGGLVLDPAWRGHPASLGRALSLVRLLFMFQHRARFCDEVHAELLPAFSPDGESELWDYLGRRFTGLSYQEADRRSRHDRHFITALFPSTPFYLSLMPPEVVATIGLVGPASKGAEHILCEIGFRFNGHIDPFDGGPHFAAPTDAITLRERLRLRSARPTADAAGRGGGSDTRPAALLAAQPLDAAAPSTAAWQADLGWARGDDEVELSAWPDAPAPRGARLTLPLRG